MMSNKGLNSNEALEERTATNSSVILSGIRREKEAPDGLDIEDYRPDSENSDRGRNQSQKSAVCQGESVLRIRRRNMKCRVMYRRQHLKRFKTLEVRSKKEDGRDRSDVITNQEPLRRSAGPRSWRQTR